MGLLLDSSFVIDLLRQRAGAVAKARELDRRRESLFVPAPAVFEVLLGIRLSRTRSEALAFRALAERAGFLALDRAAAEHAADVQAELFRLGRPASDVDVLIAGIGLAHRHGIMTGDAGFDVIAENFDLAVERY